MYSQASAQDLDLLTEVLEGDDPDLARRAVRALGRVPGGASRIASYLEREGGAVSDAVAHDLPSALNESGLLESEPRLVDELLRSSNVAEVSATVTALSHS